MSFSFYRATRCGWFGVILFAFGISLLSAEPATLSPASTPAGARYFFSIDLDSHYQIVGEGSVSADLVATSDCYCFTYDPTGRLERIEYRRANIPTADPLFQAARIDFEYASNDEKRWFRNERGQPVLDIDGISGEDLALNPAGFPTTVTNLNASGKPIRDASRVIRYDRKLDNLNRLISARRTGLLGIDITDNFGLFETRTQYDAQERRMEYGNFNSEGQPLNDADGVALTRTTYTAYPDSQASIESYFDANGLPAAEKSSGVHQRQRLFDNRGFLLSESYFDITGAPSLDAQSQIHEHRYEYNAQGELLSEEFFDVDGKLRNMPSLGAARIVYQYDALNRIIAKSYFGDDGSPQVLPNLGAAIIRQEYDNQGNIIHRQFFNGQGNPSLHKRYGAPAIRINVDGDTTTITLRDAQDKVTQNVVTGYAAFSYKTATDHPLSRKNHYFDRHGRTISRLRVFIINPHLYLLRTSPVMSASARGGAAAVGLGALLAAFIALRKASFTRGQRVYVPAPWERFVGWLAILLIGEGIIRFFITIWWAYVVHLNGVMGPTVYIIEAAYLLFFLYRLFRMRVTMRVLNISRADIHGVIREYFAQEKVEPTWVKDRETFTTDHLAVRVRYFPAKSHAYLAFHARDQEGAKSARALADHLRAQAGTLESLPHTRLIACYYPSVAFCYLLLSGIAFYTLWQTVKTY